MIMQLLWSGSGVLKTICLNVKLYKEAENIERIVAIIYCYKTYLTVFLFLFFLTIKDLQKLLPIFWNVKLIFYVAVNIDNTVF